MKSALYKTPKGTKDYSPPEQSLRQILVDKCIRQFKLYGAKPIDTPSFERTEVLMEKYNSDTKKEIFALEVPDNKKREENNDEKERLGLRYDLTVPFSRYVRTKGLRKIKRYQVGKVWRRDQPNMKSGRYREFIQCDYDCLDNSCDPASADAETLTLLDSILSDIFPDRNYTIRINNRNILYGIMKWSDISPELWETVCMTIDKLDKVKWKGVKKELGEKGISSGSIDQIGSIMTRKGETWNTLLEDDLSFLDLPTKDYMGQIWTFLSKVCPDILTRTKIDFSLARGLNYYTGLIFEVVVNSGKKGKIGSVAGGGRYDNLCDIPCVGFSIGIDRILSLLPSANKKKYNPTVWVIQIKTSQENNESEGTDDELYYYRMRIVSLLRKKGISCGTELRKETGLGQQIKNVLKNSIPYIVFIGDSELRNNTVTVKDMEKEEQTDNISLERCVQMIVN